MAYQILVIDDAEDWRNTMRAILTVDWVQRVDTARSVAEARGLMADHEYDLLVLDMVLDSISGSNISLEVQLLLEELLRKGGSIPVIAVTGQPLNPEVVFRLAGLAVRDFVTKSRIELEPFRLRVRRILEQAQQEIPPHLPPLPRAQPERVGGFIGVTDMQGSTAKIVANAAADPEHAIQYLALVLADVEDRISPFASVVRRTGDGLQFFIPGAPRQIVENVCRALAMLSAHVATLEDRNPEAREIARDAQLAAPTFRTALAFGSNFISTIDSGRDVMGLPAVQATRICALTDLYEKAATSLLVTEHAHNEGARLGLWKPADLEFLGETTLQGLATPIQLFKPRGVGV